MIAKSKAHSYMIRFENDPDFATAPAQVVKINHPLDSNLNLFSLRLGSFSFGGQTFTVPPDKTFYSTRLNVLDSLGVVVDVTAGIDATKREAFWIFESKDPATGLPPANPQLGFLPVNDSSSKGEGYVTYTVKAANHTQTGDSIHAKASIVFDINAPIETPVIYNTIDAVAPTSRITNASINRDTITLKWTGQDDAGGSGIHDYAIYVSENDGVFKLYRDGITGMSTAFTAAAGIKYCFYTIATDSTGNKESLKNICEYTTGDALPITWLYFKAQQQGKDALLAWATASEKNSKEFIVERSLDGRNFTAIGSVAANGNTNLTSNYTYTDINAMLLPVKVIYYRLKQTDKDGKFMYSIVVAIPVNQTSNEPIVKAYPNPFTQTITLQILNVTLSDKKDNVELYSIDGKRLYQKRLDNLGNSTVLLNDLPQLTPGVYLLKTVIGKRLFTIKMVRQ